MACVMAMALNNSCRLWLRWHRALLPPQSHRCGKGTSLMPESSHESCANIMSMMKWKKAELPFQITRLSVRFSSAATNSLPYINSSLSTFVYVPPAKTTAEQLCRNPLEYAVELVKHANASVTEEYVKSVASLMVIKGKKLKFPMHGSFLLSDLKNMGFKYVDFGWGKAEFAGVAKAVGPISFVNSAKDKKGEVGVVVSICLPAPAMERFVKELEKMLMQPNQGDEGR
ncbi:Transferase [Corchorus capsularis]|uniref:Transferase n=1 Tax=Corchorus capsularis TaxID=210143 RepID=A0A1R3GIN0_COCAP|nr:Transferase [Corchorus capsularis]